MIIDGSRFGLDPLGPDGRGAQRHGRPDVGRVIEQDQPLPDHLPETRCEPRGLIERGLRQQHRDRVLVARHPVQRAEEAPREDAEPLEHPVSDAVAVLAVDPRQVVYIEQDEGETISLADVSQRGRRVQLRGFAIVQGAGEAAAITGDLRNAFWAPSGARGAWSNA